MGWHTIKIRPADKWWSWVVRWEARKCEFGVKCIPQERKNLETGELDINYLECVHYFTRKKESTRFDRENTYSGCKSCHQYFHRFPEKHKEWMIKRLGQRGFDLLTIRANTSLKGTKEMQDSMVLIYCKQELPKLKERGNDGW